MKFSYLILIGIFWPVFSRESLEVDGLAIDRTLTRLGKSFYASLVERLPDGGLPSNVIVDEKYQPRYGSLISVSIDHTVVYSQIIGRQSNRIDASVVRAVGVIQAHMAQRMLSRDGQNSNPDLRGDGL